MSDQDIIEEFVKKMRRRYPDSRVVDDVVSQEVRVIQEDLTFRYAYIIKMYHAVNW